MHRVISYEDLLSFPESKEILMDGNETRLYGLLYDIGFDINKEVEYQNCLHRPMIHNLPVEGVRIFGTERTDKEWMKSTYCTMENKLEQTGMKDVALLREMLNMMKVSNFTSEIIDHIKG
jgi:hypothetical protein